MPFFFLLCPLWDGHVAKHRKVPVIIKGNDSYLAASLFIFPVGGGGRRGNCLFWLIILKETQHTSCDQDYNVDTLCLHVRRPIGFADMKAENQSHLHNSTPFEQHNPVSRSRRQTEQTERHLPVWGYG